jgi:hypothetical protein
MAKELGVSARTLWLWEAGRQKLSGRNLAKVVDLLDWTREEGPNRYMRLNQCWLRGRLTEG